MADTYGSEVGPKQPRQDMTAIDVIAGSVRDRRGAESDFTGASGPAGLHGLGGEAEPMAPGGDMYPNYD